MWEVEAEDCAVLHGALFAGHEHGTRTLATPFYNSGGISWNGWTETECPIVSWVGWGTSDVAGWPDDWLVAHEPRIWGSCRDGEGEEDKWIGRGR